MHLIKICAILNFYAALRTEFEITVRALIVNYKYFLSIRTKYEQQISCFILDLVWKINRKKTKNYILYQVLLQHWMPWLVHYLCINLHLYIILIYYCHFLHKITHVSNFPEYNIKLIASFLSYEIHYITKTSNKYKKLFYMCLLQFYFFHNCSSYNRELTV